MSRTSDDDREYIEQFIQEYRDGFKVFAKATNQEDRNAINDVLIKMEMYELQKSFHHEALARPALTFDQASLRVKKNWLGHRNPHLIHQLIIQDDMLRSGGDEDIAGHAFKISLDIARSRNLIVDSDIVRKYKESTEKNKTLETEIHQLEMKLKKCQDDFKAYKNRIQPLGRGRTERGGTEATPTPPQ